MFYCGLINVENLLIKNSKRCLKRQKWNLKSLASKIIHKFKTVKAMDGVKLDVDEVWEYKVMQEKQTFFHPTMTKIIK